MTNITKLKQMSKEEFLTLPGSSEQLYKALQNSQPGWIKVSRDYDGAGDYGITEAFGEGISCRMNNPSRWYTTSVIQSIDWENHTFKTLNSTYNFEFKTLDDLEKERKEESKRINKLLNENSGN